MESKATILITDDQENFRVMFREVLKSAGYTVKEAEDGEMALGVLRSEHIDLVLLDLVMPKVNGQEVLEQMKRDDKLKNIPIIILSAFHQKDEVVGERNTGESGYFMKGHTSPKEILEKVEELLVNTDRTL